MITDFLTSRVENKAINTFKGYVTAISFGHDPIDRLSVSLHPAVMLWVKRLIRV
jgi:hypothetical protein